MVFWSNARQLQAMLLAQLLVEDQMVCRLLNLMNVMAPLRNQLASDPAHQQSRCVARTAEAERGPQASMTQRRRSQSL